MNGRFSLALRWFIWKSTFHFLLSRTITKLKILRLFGFISVLWLFVQPYLALYKIKIPLFLQRNCRIIIWILFYLRWWPICNAITSRTRWEIWPCGTLNLLSNTLYLLMRFLMFLHWYLNLLFFWFCTVNLLSFNW